MATKIGNIVFPSGSYVKDGAEKTVWLKCGVLLQKDDGKFCMKLDALPINMNEGWFNVFEDDPKPQQQAAAPAVKAAPAEPQSDIPC